MEKTPTLESDSINEISDNNLVEQAELDDSAPKQEQLQEDAFFEASLENKPIEQWSDAEIKSQQEYVLSRMEKEISEKVSLIEAETERQILDIAGEAYIEITQGIGLSEPESIKMVGDDKMIKILGEERVRLIQEQFNQEVMNEAAHILEDAFSKVRTTLNEGVPRLSEKVNVNHKL